MIAAPKKPLMRLSDFQCIPNHALSVTDIRIDGIPYDLADDGDTLIERDLTQTESPATSD